MCQMVKSIATSPSKDDCPPAKSTQMMDDEAVDLGNWG